MLFRCEMPACDQEATDRVQVTRGAHLTDSLILCHSHLTDVIEQMNEACPPAPPREP